MTGTAMELVPILLFLPLGLSILFTGILVNLLQAVAYIIIRPSSTNTFRKINGALSQVIWLQLLNLLDWFAGFQIKVYTDMETHKLMGKERAIIISNHISDLDTTMISHIAHLAGCLPGALFVLKKSAKYLPIYGWAARFSEHIFLDRDWTKDESKLKSSLEALRDFPMPFWLSIFPEGTRFSPGKLHAAKDFAVSRGLPPPKNVLIPRTKGFVAMMQTMRAFVPAVYDMTIYLSEGDPIPSTLRVLKCQSSKLMIHIKRYPIEEVPKTDEGMIEWCHERFRAKDAFLDRISSLKTFDEPEILSFSSSIVPPMVTFLCVGLTIMGACAMCIKYPQGFTLLGMALGLVVVARQCLIKYTKFPTESNATTLK